MVVRNDTNPNASLGILEFLDIDGTTGMIPIEASCHVGPVMIRRVDMQPLYVLDLEKLMCFCDWVMKITFRDNGIPPAVNPRIYEDKCRLYDEILAERRWANLGQTGAREH